MTSYLQKMSFSYFKNDFNVFLATFPLRESKKLASNVILKGGSVWLNRISIKMGRKMVIFDVSKTSYLQITTFSYFNMSDMFFYIPFLWTRARFLCQNFTRQASNIDICRLYVKIAHFGSLGLCSKSRY